jgi:hypothetical protein
MASALSGMLIQLVRPAHVCHFDGMGDAVVFRVPTCRSLELNRRDNGSCSTVLSCRLRAPRVIRSATRGPNNSTVDDYLDQQEELRK